MANQQVLAHQMSAHIDHSDAVRGPERDKPCLAVRSELDANRLDRLAPQTRNLKSDLSGHVVLERIDHADAAADLGGDPKLSPIRLELGVARPRIDEHVREDLARNGVDEVLHAGLFRRAYEDRAVGTDGHAFRLNPDRHVGEPRACLDVNDRDRVVGLIRHIKTLPRWIMNERLWVGTGRHLAVDPMRLRIDHLNRVVVARGAQYISLIARDRDATRTLPHLDGARDLPRAGIYDRYGVALFVRDISEIGVRRHTPDKRQREPEKKTKRGDHAHFSLHLVSGRS